MHKIFISLLMSLSFLSVSPILGYDNESLTKPVPSYSKWGTLAVQEISKKYPNAIIKDYLHVGRKEMSPTSAEET